MAYMPTEWKSGDVITAEKLNNMEEGISDSNIFIVNVTRKLSGDPTADKTFAEIKDAYDSGKIIICRLNLQTVPSDTMPMNTYDCAMNYVWQGGYFYASWVEVDLFNASNHLDAKEITIDASGVSYNIKQYVLTESN